MIGTEGTGWLAGLEVELAMGINNGQTQMLAGARTESLT